MKFRSSLMLTAVVASALLVACKKTEPPAPAPEPKAEASSNEAAGPGTTTNFENPQPAATEPAKPAQ